MISGVDESLQYGRVIADPDWLQFVEQYEKGGNAVVPSLSKAEKAGDPKNSTTGSATAPLKTNLMEALEGKLEKPPPRIIEVLNCFSPPLCAVPSPCIALCWLRFCPWEADR